ncbi:trypsin-like serine protease [Streptomyces sp. WI04-05B]|uniref:trypsin-like serine protease n=1 Tax=Streptomyces TaxID=1883 RepID=UPI0029B15EFF|nr:MULTISPECIES: trypsin-like serine protease [unclassified Streptomyces]MDX2542396.1 trypsin-like serine protease [Streptomyces sp. WI04-05B]MDX2582585.1 trypsin-like serine protease [Streptomyces sp. WI04-05A]
MRHTRPVRLAALAATLTLGSAALAAGSAGAVTGPAVPAATTTYAYTAQVTVGDHDRGCSGVLVDREWLLTAASCFVADPAAGLTVPAGKPALTTTATIGRSDLTGTGGAVREIVELVPRTDRDAVLARLNRPVTNVTPLALATAAPTAGEELTLAGFGRSTTEWAPLNLHTGAFSVDASTATNATVTGKNGAAACMGDTGGPLVRTVDGTAQLAALSSRSYQGGCFGIDAAETRTGGIATRVDDLASWVNSKTGAVRVTDFNCDGVEDIAVSDPRATVGTVAAAGVVRIVYGGGKGTAEINQNLDWVSGTSEASDWFGESLATVDYDEDGCTDLVVGTPAEDIGSPDDTGSVDILHGAPGGLGTGTKKSTHFEEGAGTGSLKAGTPQAGDRLGDSIAAGVTANGEPFIVAGAPGETVNGAAKAGEAFYIHGGTNIVVHQDSTDVPGAAEANDGFGGAVAADTNFFAVGAPGEAIGTDAGAGNLAVFSHTLTSAGLPTPRFGLDQDLDTVSGGAEAGDQFGYSLALAPYRPSGAASATESILAVGSPGEDLDIDGVAKADTGTVLTFRIAAAGTYTQLYGINQGTADDDVSGGAEAGDRMGVTLSAINTAPRAVSTTATMKLAVGDPNEAVGTAANAGAVHTFSLLGAPGANDRWLEVGDGDGIPGTPAAGQQLGSSIHYTGTKLYVGMPLGPSTYGTLYALPHSNVTAGGAVAAVTTYQPGTGGLPAAGDRFGYAAR